jgi:uncharacterized protein YpuA (DUF1002 family)
MRSHLKSIVAIMVIAACPMVALARDRSESAVATSSSPPVSMPTDQLPLHYEPVGNNKALVDIPELTAYINGEIQAKKAVAAQISRSTAAVVEARELVEANTEEIKLANLQREMDVQKLKEVFASMQRMYADWQVTKDNLLKTEQNLVATRGELQTTQNHLGATQGQLQSAQGHLNQSSQMLQKLKARALMPFPLDFVANIFNPL